MLPYLHYLLQAWRWGIDRSPRKDWALWRNDAHSNCFRNGWYFYYFTLIFLNNLIIGFFIFRQTLSKRKYLCTSDYDEGYFSFHCLPGGKKPSKGVEWYTACGTPFPNKVEYLLVVGGVTWVAFLVFLNLHFRSALEVVYRFRVPVIQVQRINQEPNKSKKMKQK